MCKFGRFLLCLVWHTYLSFPVRIPARGPILKNRAYKWRVGEILVLLFPLFSILIVKCSAFQAFFTVCVPMLFSVGFLLPGELFYLKFKGLKCSISVKILRCVLNLAAWQAQRFHIVDVWIRTALGLPTAKSSYSLKREVVIMPMILMIMMMMAVISIIIIIHADCCSR